MDVQTHTGSHPNTNLDPLTLRLTLAKGLMRTLSVGQFYVLVASFVTRTKLLYTEPG